MYAMRSVTLHKASCIFVLFENELCPTTVVQQRQLMDAVDCHTFYSRLISMFDFDILQIVNGCIQICSGYTPMAMGLSYTSTTPYYFMVWLFIEDRDIFSCT